jgi:GTP cyclohydrolase IA
MSTAAEFGPRAIKGDHTRTVTAAGGEPQREPDLVAATRGARLLLQALGIDVSSESMARTPERLAAGLAEMLTPRPFQLTTFPNDADYDELIVARSIPVRSLCEHHMLPFVGTAHVGYLPGQRIVGLSKLARVVDSFCRRPQVQERLTTQIANWFWTRLSPAGVGVVVEAEHLCMTLRGVQAAGTTTITSSLLGTIRDDARTRAEFLALTHPPR